MTFEVWVDLGQLGFAGFWAQAATSGHHALATDHSGSDGAHGQ